MTKPPSITKTAQQVELERIVYDLRQQVAALQAPPIVLYDGQGLTLGATWTSPAAYPFRVYSYPNGVVWITGRLTSSSTVDLVCYLPHALSPQYQVAAPLRDLSSGNAAIDLKITPNSSAGGAAVSVVSAGTPKSYEVNVMYFRANRQ